MVERAAELVMLKGGSPRCRHQFPRPSELLNTVLSSVFREGEGPCSGIEEEGGALVGM